MTPYIPDTCDGFRCKLGQCLTGDRICDRHWDCMEGEDELDCPIVPATSLVECQRHEDNVRDCSCPAGTRKCDNNLCLEYSKWCNGESECGDMSDEPATCSTCLGHVSLTSPGDVCDGVRHCSDLADETPGACGCPDHSWRCDQVSANLNMSSLTTGKGRRPNKQVMKYTCAAKG